MPFGGKYQKTPIQSMVHKMCIGNGFGFDFTETVPVNDLFAYAYGSFLLEVDRETAGQSIGEITENPHVSYKDEKVAFETMDALYEGKLENVYPTRENGENKAYTAFPYERKEILVPGVKTARPKVLIPVFPGTNCSGTATDLWPASATASRRW